jgi:hypothetical protein
MKNIPTPKNQKGAALVEFAIVLPMLMLIIFGIIEFSLLLYDKAVITNASREAARAGIVYTMLRPDPNDSTTYTDRVNTNTEDIEKVGTDYCQDYLITFAGGDGSLSVDLLSSPCEKADDDLIINVSYNYNFLIFPDILAGFFGGSGDGDITLTAQTVMRCE